MKGGGLWKQRDEVIKAKHPESATLAKVKGHATDGDVQSGEVDEEDKKGNGEADDAAERGANGEQVILEALAGIYAKRHMLYAKFTERV